MGSKIRTVLFATNCKSFNRKRLWKLTLSMPWWKIWYQTQLLRIVKNIWQTILQEKLPVKKLEKQQVPKSEIITITRHSREPAIDAYDSCDKVQQKQLWNLIDNYQPTVSKNKYSISPNSPIIRNPLFNFFPNEDQFYQNISASNPFSLWTTK